jgi:hypothetical protein
LLLLPLLPWLVPLLPCRASPARRASLLSQRARLEVVFPDVELLLNE